MAYILCVLLKTHAEINCQDQEPEFEDQDRDPDCKHLYDPDQHWNMKLKTETKTKTSKVESWNQDLSLENSKRVRGMLHCTHQVFRVWVPTFLH